ncbi:MAG: hypothetical protein QXS79_05145 [Candidatus Bathyarchaeia archaeon]
MLLIWRVCWRSEFEGGRLLREMEILKMRGTSTPEGAADLHA